MEHSGYMFLTNISITAFSIISESYNLDKVSSSEEDCVSEDSEPPPTNSVMNNMMNSLYSQPRKPLAPKPISEPIDISSGDENEDDSNTKTTNGDGVAAAVAPPPPTPAVQGSALKRLMEEVPEIAVAAKKGGLPIH